MASRLDDEFATRLVGSQPVARQWYRDWACTGCRRFGRIKVEIEGGPVDPVSGRKLPKTSDEDMDRALYEAHREATSGLCPWNKHKVMCGLIWRWERTREGRQMTILKDRKDSPLPRNYKWPPWVE